jgi:hypothetical protein
MRSIGVARSARQNSFRLTVETLDLDENAPVCHAVQMLSGSLHWLGHQCFPRELSQRTVVSNSCLEHGNQHFWAAGPGVSFGYQILSRSLSRGPSDLLHAISDSFAETVNSRCDQFAEADEVSRIQ